MNMIARIITGSSAEQCKIIACDTLGLPDDGVRMSILSEGSDTRPFIYAAYPSAAEPAVANMSAAFSLFYEESGVYFELVPASGAGDNIPNEAVISYLRRKNITALDAEKVSVTLKTGYGRTLVAPPQNEYFCPGEAVVSVSKNEMEAYICFLPPDENGARMTPADIEKAAAAAGVTCGLDLAQAEIALEAEQYETNILIASGLPPVAGTDGKIEYHFKLTHTFSPLVSSENDKVDYKVLDVFDSVITGQKLVTRTPPTDGQPGCTVKGRELRQQKGRDARMPAGKNTELAEDKLTMYAKMNGRVDLINGVVCVSDCYQINGNVDYSIGNIDFDGDIIIKGHIITGLVIKSTCNIEVYGPVEGATLIANGNIVLHSGIQGSDKGRLQADGDISAKYIERSVVAAKGRVTAEAIMHSTVESDVSVEATGKRGIITGGVIRAQQFISARNIGSQADSKTSLEVGAAPSKRARLHEIEHELAPLRSELDKYEKHTAYFAALSTEEQEKRAELRKSIVLGKLRVIQQIKAYTDEAEMLAKNVADAVHGKVHVSEKVLPGVRISISTGSYTVVNPITFATFKFADKEVVFQPYEL